jgi:hypothetical protein
MPREFAAVDPADLERLAARLGQPDSGEAPVGPDAATTAAEVAKLRGQVRDLRMQLAEALGRPAERVEVPVFAEGDIRAMEIAVTLMKDATAKVADAVMLARAAEMPQPAAPEHGRIPAPETAWPRTEPGPGGWPIPAPGEPDAADTTVALSKAQRAVLTVLAQFPDGRTKRQVAMLAGYSAKGGGFNNSLSSLRSSGLIERGEPIRITPEGLSALGEWEPLPEGAALVEYWLGQLSKAEAAALRALLDAWPAALTKAEVAERAGYAADGGGFNNALSRLRTLQLIDGYGQLRADETLAEGIPR